MASAAVLLIAALDAACSYAERYLTTSVGQWVAHDLRRTRDACRFPKATVEQAYPSPWRG